jgi:salicylate hydroxylase
VVGAKSTLRQLIYPDIQLTSYYNFYRAVVDGALLESVPELAPLLDAGNFWWGPDRTVVGIPLQNKTFYSFECCHPGSTGTAGDWNKKGEAELMKKAYADFEPAIGKVMELVKPEDLLVWVC